MSAVNDPFYSDGSVELLQSTGTTVTVYYVLGSVYVVYEYVSGGGGSAALPMAMNYYRRMRD